MTNSDVSSVSEVRRDMPRVFPEPVCDTKNDRRLDGSGYSQPTEGPAAEEPHGRSRRIDTGSRSRLEPPFHRPIRRRRRVIRADERAFHHTHPDEELSNDDSGKCAAGQEPDPPREATKKREREQPATPCSVVARIGPLDACRPRTPETWHTTRSAASFSSRSGGGGKGSCDGATQEHLAARATPSTARKSRSRGPSFRSRHPRNHVLPSG